MLKLGFRNNNFYPLMLLLFIFLRKCLEIIIKYHDYKDNVDFIISFLIFFSQSLIGFIIYLCYSKKNKTKRKTNNLSMTITLKKDNELNKSLISNASKLKRICLIIFASFFNFTGSTIRSVDVYNSGKKEENNSLLEVRVRGIQIIISALLCHFSIRLTIYKHQKFSLIIISIFLIFILITELIISINIGKKLLALLFSSVSCLFRAFLDVTEKYLFDYDYFNIFEMLIYEGIIGVFLFIFYFLSNNTYQEHGRNILKDMSTFDWTFVYFIFLIVLYIIISGLRNSYRVTTNKYYSPMSRALFESTLDPFIFLYYTLTYKDKDEYVGYWIYFGFVLFCLIVIAFFTLVYNDFIILYCFGLEHNTYNEITSRIISQENFEEDDGKISIYSNYDYETKGDINIELMYNNKNI